MFTCTFSLTFLSVALIIRIGRGLERENRHMRLKQKISITTARIQLKKWDEDTNALTLTPPQDFRVYGTFKSDQSLLKEVSTVFNLPISDLVLVSSERGKIIASVDLAEAKADCLSYEECESYESEEE